MIQKVALSSNMSKSSLLFFIGLFVAIKGDFESVTTTTDGSEIILSIGSGTGFASCAGYCYEHVLITSSTIYTTKGSSQTDVFPELQDEQAYNTVDFNQLVQSIDLQQFRTISGSIGNCQSDPDCGGSGSEWLAIITNHPPKISVLFPYNTTIVGCETLLQDVRQIRDDYLANNGN
ncbi:unnamed protein product [Didymodactylos carnosus]|uniref:Uncharacterized protein n=1 Tax=Didymodactylos carnosus TaxID=1234261 RepID=A0A813XKA5_9BILA|nr:unnamed protein product [Didymodactylos carnosus]CAF0871144.1 unnamed protein product [Didymodactylos carnosus]CAF3641142.1 unnamed protein product [Didymodactylos carnosus]CAF3658431.1 unnamed protein product [Didymodactylos carnosus]